MMKMSDFRRLIGRRRMGTGTKIMLMAVPVLTFMVGKMIGSRMNGDQELQ